MCLCGALLAVANLAHQQYRSDSNPIAPPPARAVQYNRIFSLPVAVVALHLLPTSARRARQAKNPLHYAKSLIMESCLIKRVPTAATERLVPFLSFT